MTHQRNIYLKMTSLENARELMFERFAAPSPPVTETVPVTDAVGRVLAAPVLYQYMMRRPAHGVTHLLPPSDRSPGASRPVLKQPR